MTIVRIGCGAGFADDRTDAAVPIVAELARHDGPRFLIFETLAERTLALAQIARRRDPDAGAGAGVERFLRPVLADCLKHGIRIVSNFGAANPVAAARIVRRLAAELGHPRIRIAVVEGDDVGDAFSIPELAAREVMGDYLACHPQVISANAYIGAAQIAEGLDMGADIVVAGRVSDPSLALGPLIHAFGWGAEDWDRLAAGTLVGHLLECGSQVTGGYFADPGVKDVPDLDRVGYPIAEVREDGRFVITKPGGTGGRVDRATVTEQLLYEIHDPAAYLTPDVVMDVGAVTIHQDGPDRVSVAGVRGKPRPETLKATVCIDGGMLAEGEISYAGPNAAARGRLAIEVLRKRLARSHPGLHVRADLIGVASLFNDSDGQVLDGLDLSASDVRVRIAAQSFDRRALETMLDEVRALYCAGPAGGAGIRAQITPRFRSASCLLERDRIAAAVRLIEEA
ncbi:acyclic terpene utilization AtuA family protein [Paracoccus pantotrophus]|uniref:acyclic terpene utilization AtuA family protein n=1 Tax=Paracoccus pantotrophus TaxID=82367 RepID=UPI0008EB1175|nr:acyclic terpene utilization AtuA family protein [Paracoccus pantotrophus]MDF3856237.1 DUF1446 domain-containing protein [Paracoccus pantotrophus]SFP02620.1 Protein of unknown function [Paracoccus pantotrophus]